MSRTARKATIGMPGIKERLGKVRDFPRRKQETMLPRIWRRLGYSKNFLTWSSPASGMDFEQPGLVKGGPAHGRWLELDDL